MKLSKGNKTALVFGSTGLVGKHLVEYLLLHPAYEKVVAFSRRPLEIEHPKLVVEIIEFSQLENYGKKIVGDDLYCCLGTTMRKAGNRKAFTQVDFTYPLTIAKIGLANKVNQFLLVSSVGADPNSMFFYSRVKGTLEEAVKTLEYWSIHIFRPSVLLGERNDNRWGEELAGRLGKGIDTLTGGMLSKYRPIEADIVAKAMVGAAQQLEEGVHLYPSHFLQKLAEKESALIRK